MNEPQCANPYLLRSNVLQLRTEDQQAELVRIRCEVVLQQKIWLEQQQHLQQDNQLLMLALLQAGAVNNSTRAQLQLLTQHSQHDALTQTLNRSVMLDRIQQAISLAKRQQHAFALLFIDLNNFKPINDSYGHAAGDAVLQQVGQRLQQAVRDSDAVSRHGGDEFLLLLNNLKHPHDAGIFADKLTQLLAEPYQVEQGVVHLSASIGLAQYPIDADNAQALINHADAAMYRVKQQGNKLAR